ncbi:hypothetical protein ID866_9700 [Astraeus odoratus]|nr:hypothetical protein ID866_9700 [Astraeus odoratus]
MAFPAYKGKSRSTDGDVLPITSPKRVIGPSYGLTRRILRLIVCLAVLLSLSAYLVLQNREHPEQSQSHVHQPSNDTNRLPPLYERFRERDRSLPHYDAYEQNRSVKYFWPAQHAHSCGWGNVLQDYVMMALLAHATGRSFVFDDYVWDPIRPNYSDWNGIVIPSLTPLSALVGGPMVGGPWPAGDGTPRAVNKHFFEKVCPNPTVIHVSDINTDQMRFTDSAVSVFSKWVEVINAVDDPCLMLHPSGNQVFEFWIFGHKHRMHTLWPRISHSPVLTSWDWSPLIHAAYTRNRHFFQRKQSRFAKLVGLPDFSGSEDPRAPIKGLLAIHVRRGDFEEHCRNLAGWRSDWNAWNAFPEFIDQFEKPDDDVALEVATDIYVEHCYPTVAQIVDKVRRVRQGSRPKHKLSHLYIMTNGPLPWIQELKAALVEDAERHQGSKWESVMSSRDLELTWEEKFVAQSLDMMVGQKAEVIIGNGWSSLTSNVAMLRMANGFPPDSVRFW